MATVAARSSAFFACGRRHFPTLVPFNGSDGDNPNGGLTLSGVTLYGTTYGGGAYGDGTVYSIPLGGGTPTVLASFDGSNGSNPVGNLTLIGNTLYGTTYGGGAYNEGTVFAVNLTPTPEPSTLVLLGIGAMGLVVYGWKKHKVYA